MNIRLDLQACTSHYSPRLPCDTMMMKLRVAMLVVGFDIIWFVNIRDFRLAWQQWS